MSMTTELAQRMKAAALKATEGPWIIFDDDWSDDEDAVITNEARDDACASPIAVIKGGGTDSCSSSSFYAEQRANAALIALASPDNIRALVEALEAKEKQRSAANKVVIQQDIELQELRQRIAELEARTVKLPEAFYPDGDIDCPLAVNLEDVKEMLQGIGVAVEGE